MRCRALHRHLPENARDMDEDKRQAVLTAPQKLELIAKVI
jgi:hypothetical protein